MTAEVLPTLYSTVSRQFIADWLDALRLLCSDAEFHSFLERADVMEDQDPSQGRVTLDQIVCLYQLAAVETGDEMMGLWGRPIRPRALQHLLTSVREATSLTSALYRFSTFWNLLLDDYQFRLMEAESVVELALIPQGNAPVQRFGHMLILKLAHGLMSWLAKHEVPVKNAQCRRAGPFFGERTARLDFYAIARTYAGIAGAGLLEPNTVGECKSDGRGAVDAHDPPHTDPQARSGRNVVSIH